jgi:hypothetical protein
MRGPVHWILLCLAPLLIAAPASAQIAWDSPQLMPSRILLRQPEFSVYVIDGAGAGVGVVGLWRGSRDPQIGMRFGIGDRQAPRREGGGIDALAGIEAFGQLTRATADFPLDIAWFLGVGAGFGRRVRMSVPLGLSAGYTFEGQGVQFQPYLSPRVILDGVFGVGSGLDLGFAADLGIDIGFQPNWLVRFGGTFGDREAIAIGVVF